ncbi:MAG: hypothetical protein Q8S13_05210 [Dehalococcoidia bacterium]|nr:hypothetical protein [Dehalococcoidia bacterium]
MAATLHVGVLRAFNSGTYKARVTLKGSLHMSLDNIRVNRGIASADMVAGREVTVVIYDETKATDAVVVGVYA